MTAFEPGYAAHRDGEAQDANPFDDKKSPHSRKRWDAGWKKRAQHTQQYLQIGE